MGGETIYLSEALRGEPTGAQFGLAKRSVTYVLGLSVTRAQSYIRGRNWTGPPFNRIRPGIPRFIPERAG